MLKIQIEMERSPFHTKRNDKAPRGSENLQAQVSTDMFNDFMKYAEQYNKEHKVPQTKKGDVNKSAPLKHIINMFLNNNAIERKCFDDLYVIMAFNKIDFNKNSIKPELDGSIIGFVRHPEKFTKFEPFGVWKETKNTSKIINGLVDFDKETFDMLNLKELDDVVFFGIEPYFYKSFEDLKLALTRLYEPIDFDNAQICMFNLNNYLDVLKDGVYVSKHSTYAHEGVVVLLDIHDVYKNNCVVLRFKWSYSAGVLTFDPYVEDLGFFNETLCNDVPVVAHKDYWNISSGFLDISAKYELDFKNSNLRLIMLEQKFKEEFEAEKKRNAELKQWLVEHDKL